MDNNDEHDEDDLPIVSLPMSHYTQRISNDNDEQDNNHPNRLLENWQNLYETSVQSLQSEDEDQQKSFNINRQPSIEQPVNQINDERPYSPINQSQFDTNTIKSKWEIRPPQLLNTMVGPDRQKRDVIRRHTTNIVFQQSNSQTKDFNPYLLSQTSHETDNNNQPINPLVKQLKQKFDQMTTNNTTLNDTKNHSQSPSNTPKLHRVGSLTCRGLTANTGERIIRKPRPVLPIRPSPEITTSIPRSSSNTSLNNRIPLTNDRTHRGPPISYPKHYYPPPSTTSVVKQVIGGGATLIYDSIKQKNELKPKRSIIKHPINIEQTTENLKSTNSILTGRQLSSTISSNDYATIQHKKNNNYESIQSKEDESDENYYERISPKTSFDSSIKKSTEPWNHRRNTNENNTENSYSIYKRNK